MALITWSDVVAVAPELVSASAATQAAALAAVEDEIDLDVWGSTAARGGAYLAAHMATIARMRGSGGVSSESVGSMSRSYVVPQGCPTSLALTAYGAEYYRLTRLLPDAILGVVP